MLSVNSKNENTNKIYNKTAELIITKPTKEEIQTTNILNLFNSDNQKNLIGKNYSAFEKSTFNKLDIIKKYNLSEFFALKEQDDLEQSLSHKNKKDIKLKV